MLDELFDQFNGLFDSFSDTISSWFSSFYNLISNFFTIISQVLSYIWEILQSLWYGITTILTGLYDIVIEVFSVGFFTILGDTFTYISHYIGSWGATVLATLFFIVLIRIAFAFVLKLFRFNLDYHAPQKNSSGGKSNKSDIDKIVKDFHQSVGD